MQQERFANGSDQHRANEMYFFACSANTNGNQRPGHQRQRQANNPSM
jgi:hypothetical protein